MKLTKADREYLKRNFWENEDHIDQIEAAIGKTTFEHDHKYIGVKDAIELCGRELFLSAMDRSAFHRSCCVTLPDGSHMYFDSKKFFYS